MIVLVIPLYITYNISKRLENIYSESLRDAMSENRLYYGPDFGLMMTLLLTVLLIFIGLLTPNYPLIGFPQSNSNPPIFKFFYVAENFISINSAILIAVLFGIVTLALTLPIFIDWYKKRNDVWGGPEELFE